MRFSNADLIEMFIGSKRSYTERTRELYAYWLRRFDEFVGKSFLKVKQRDVNRFLDKFKGSSSEHFIYQVLRTFYNYLSNPPDAEREKDRGLGLLNPKRNPMAGVSRPKANFLSKIDEHQFFTEDEFKAFLGFLKRENYLFYYWITLLLWRCVLRVGELLPYKSSERDGWVLEESGDLLKTRNGRVKIYPDGVVEFKVKRNRTKKIADLEEEEIEYLVYYLRSWDKPLVRSYQYMIKRLVDEWIRDLEEGGEHKMARRIKAKKRFIRPHFIRHTAISHLRHGKMGEPDLKRVAGLSPKSKVLDRYSHTTDELASKVKKGIQLKILKGG